MTIAGESAHRFKYHAADPPKAVLHQQVREGCSELAALFEQIVPPGREQSLALTNLEEAMFWANAGIARS